MATSKKRAKSERERRTRRAEALKRYSQTPKGKFRQHKQNAARRGVPFFLSFDEWLAVWLESGHYDQRGNQTAHGFVMARFGDSGPYAKGNVEIIPHAANVAQRNRTVALRRRMVRAWKAIDETDDWRHIHNAEGID